MFLNSFFKNNKTFSATIQDKTQTMTSGVPGPVTWTDLKTVDCILWRGSMSDSLVSDRVRADVAAVAVMKPSQISMSDIPDDSRIMIKNGSTLVGYYSAISPDNIAGQEAVLMVPLKEFK